VWRLTVKDPDERKCRAISTGLNDLALASIPGFYGLGGNAFASPFGVHTSGLVPAEMVPQHVVQLDGPRSVVESTAPESDTVVEIPTVDPVEAPGGETRRVPIGLVVGARSGDKGGNANLGVFARSAEAYVWLESILSDDMLRELLPEAAELEIERYPLPNIWSLNFLIHGILQEGVAASTRQDGQAKSLGEWLRARHVDVPVSLLEHAGR